MSEQLNDGGNRRIAKNTLFLYIRLVFVLLISLYTSRVVLQTLGVLDYGIYNIVAGFVSMFSLLNASLANSTQRFYNYQKGKKGDIGMQNVFITAHYIQFIIAFLVLLFAETIGLWYVENKMVYPIERATAVHVIFHSGVVALLFVIMQIPYSAAIIAHERINYYAVVGVLEVVMKLIIVLVLPIIPADHLSAYGVLVATVSIITYLLYFIYCRFCFPYLRYKRQFQKGLFFSMLKFSGWKAFNSFSQTARHQGLNLLMNLFFGPTVNAARGLSYQVKTALLGFVSNITTAAQPQMVESYADGNIERSKKLMFTVSKLVFLSLYCVALPIIWEVPFVLHLWLGNEVPDFTSVFTRLVLITTLIDILSSPIGIIISASGRVARFDFWNSIIGILALPIAYVVLNNGGNPVSVFYTSLLVSFMMLIATVIVLKKETGISINNYCHDVLLPLIIVVMSTALFPGISLFFFPEGFLRLSIISVISILLVLVSGYIWGLDASERIFILNLLKRLKRTIR